MSDNKPWLHIPAADYERHMEEIGQGAALRAIFERAYAAARPVRLLVLGCTTGRDLALIDPATTSRAVGVDLNPDYLAAARGNLVGLGQGLELIQGDALTVDLGVAAFDLIHVALLFEYVEPSGLFGRIQSWLAPGAVCCVVTQDPAAGASPVSQTAYQSLRLLDGHMALVTADEVARRATDAGLERAELRSVSLPGAKSFSVSTFRKP